MKTFKREIRKAETTRRKTGDYVGYGKVRFAIAVQQLREGRY